MPELPDDPVAEYAVERGTAEDDRALRAFRHRDFTVFWCGALVSNIGSWLQNLAVPYVVFEITGSALWVGLATAAQGVPGFLGSPVGGHLADIRERRALLIVLQSLMAASALLLWALWASGSRSLAGLLGLVAVMGLLWGMTLPSWQAYVNDLVPRSDLVSAVSLNSLQFNAARSIGPMVAGLVIAAYGPGVAFALNAVSFGVVVVALLLVRTRSRVAGAADRDTRFLPGLREAIRYVPTQPGIAVVILLVAAVGMVASPVFGFTVVFAGSVYHVGAFEVGLLNTALGVGAVAAVPLVVRAKSHGGLAVSIRTGMLVLGVAIIGFGLAPGPWTGALCLVAVGLGFLTAVSSGNTAVQFIVAQRLRGRVMALRLMAFLVAGPIGALLLGWLSDRVGPRPAVVIGGASLLALALPFLVGRGARLLARVDDPPDMSG